MNRINHAIITKYDIELVIFTEGQRHPDCYYKDIETNRCYEETGTKNLKSQFEIVKRRIKNADFENTMKTCQIPEAE
jgi:hypothetical protein